MIFSLSCIGLVLLCVAYLYRALAKTTPEEVDVAAKALYSQRLRELQEDIDAGEIVAAQEKAAQDDIVRVTLDDEKQVRHRDGVNAPLVPSLLGVLVVLSAISLTTYWKLGDIDRALGREPAAAMNMPMDEASIQEAISNLKQQLETNPDSAEGWALLGRTMMAIGNYPEALTALKKANELVPDAPGLMLQYADAIAMNAGGELTEEAQLLVKRVLTLDPDNIAALWLAGLGAAERQDKAQAMTYLSRARELSAAAGVSTEELDNVLARLQGDAEPGAPRAAPATSGQDAESLPEIHLVVDIDPELEKNLTGEETLFVFARVEGQGGPPVAVRRVQNANFPLPTTLDRSMSMAPQFRLSKGQTIAVAARLSKSGQAMPQVGDLVGAGPAFAYPENAPTEAQPLTITIDSTQR